MSAPGDEDPIERLLAIMARLRDPDRGCPWDREQTWHSIVPHTLEEAYEVADAIERRDFAAVKDELGDLLFQVVYYARFAAEEGRFEFRDVVEALNAKMVRRHPHVFGNEVISNSTELRARWDAAKAAERAADPERSASSELDDVPVGLPALSRAAKIQRRAARVSFDFDGTPAARDKLGSELEELDEALASADPAQVEHELGDVLFAAVNVARHEGLDPEAALRRATQRFETRFRYVESALAAAGRSVSDADTEALERLWMEAKRAEAAGR